jgi:type VI secretion system protein ImpL
MINIRKLKKKSPATEVDKRQKHFLGALRFLKKTKISGSHQRIRLYDLPWYLLIGDNHSSKSKLLAESNLKFLLTKRDAKAYQDEQRHCDWFATREAVFLDCNSQYFEFSEKPIQPFWTNLLSLLKKRHVPSLQGIIVTINLADLAIYGKEKLQPLLLLLKQRLQDIEAILKHSTPVYFLFHHSDCLAGFAEYFEHLSPEELQRPFGISLSQAQISTMQKISDTFDVEFDHLLTDLNQVLIAKLHQQRSLEKRAKIKDFPLQMESLKRPLATFLQQLSPCLMATKHCNLRGLYFMSQGNYDEQVDRLLKPLTQSFELTPTTPKKNQGRARNYFISGFFTDILFQDATLFTAIQNQTSWTRQRWAQHVAATTAAVLIISAVVNWSSHFNQEMKNLTKAESMLTQYKILEKTQSLSSLKQQITALDLLYAAKNSLSRDHFYWFLRFDHQRRNDLTQTATAAYEHVLTQLVSTELTSLLQASLATSSAGHAAMAYTTLKYYLMLNDPTHLDLQALRSWLGTQVNQLPNLNASERRMMLHHLEQFSLQDARDIVFNHSLVEAAQQVLQQTPPELLALAIVEDDFSNKPATILYHPIPNTFNALKTEQNVTVPAMYTQAHFREIYDTLIPVALTRLYQDHWILGNEHHGAPSEETINQTREQYIAQYQKVWMSLITQLPLQKPTTVAQAQQTLQELTTTNSPLQQLLTQVYQNTHITYENLPTPISLKFAVLDDFIAQNPLLHDASLQTALASLTQSLEQLSQAAEPNAAAFALSKQWLQAKDNPLITLESFSPSVPQPVQQWLQQASENTVQLLMKQTTAYIEKEWRTTVLTEYQNRIAPYYPIAQDSEHELAVSDFQHFYGPKGTLLTFFENNISPFTVVDRDTRTWRNLSSQTLAMDPKFLTEYVHAEEIAQAMFNPVSGQYGMQLALAPLSMGNTLQEIDVAINNAGAQYTRTRQTPAVFYWPDAEGNGQVNITFVDQSGKEASIATLGPWALYKLLDASVTEEPPENETVHFALTLNDQMARFTLVSRNPNNPLRKAFLHELAIDRG